MRSGLRALGAAPTRCDSRRAMRLTSGRAQQGQASPEFLGLAVFAVAVVVTLTLSGPSVGRDVGATFKRAICVVGAPMTGETCPARPANKPRPPKDPCAAAAGGARVAPSPPPPPKASWGEWGAHHGIALPDPD